MNKNIEKNDLVEVKIKYAHYKKQYPNAPIVQGTYDSKMKMITILLPSSTASIIDKKAGNRLKHVICDFKINDSEKIIKEKWFNFFTYEGLNSQIEKFETENNCIQINSKKSL